MARTTTDRSSAGFAVPAFAQRFADDDAGFSLIESLVAFTIFMIVSVSAVWGLVKVIQLTSLTTNRANAAQLATQELERMRNQANAGQQVDSAGKCAPVTACQVTLHGTTFTVTPSLYPDPHVTTDPSCSSIDPTAATHERRLSVVVTWNSNPPRSVRYDSVLTC